MISVCVPMYNESSIIADTAKTLHSYMTSLYGNDFEIIFSDDGSRDNSTDIVNALGLPNIKVVGYEKNRGKGCAVRHAVLASLGDIVIFTDADLAYGVDIIAQAVDELHKNDCSVVVASRAAHPQGYKGYTIFRKVASKTYIKILNMR